MVSFAIEIPITNTASAMMNDTSEVPGKVPLSRSYSATRRSSRNGSSNLSPVATHTPQLPQPTRSSLGRPMMIKDSEDEDDELSFKSVSSPAMMPPTGKIFGRGKVSTSRASMSSVSSLNEYGNGSGYSTPATSAVTTPAPVPEKEKLVSARTRGRPARAAVTAEVPAEALRLFQRAKELRTSEHALVSEVSKKRTALDDDDDDDNSRDAQLARALQDEEDSVMIDDEEDYTPRRTSRPLRSIRPKASYKDDNSDAEHCPESYLLGQTMTRGTKKQKLSIPDSDESGFQEVSSEEEPLAQGSFSRRRKQFQVKGVSSDEDIPLARRSVGSKFGSKANSVSLKKETVERDFNKSNGRTYRTAYTATLQDATIEFQREDTEASAISTLSTLDSAFDSMGSELDSVDDEVPEAFRTTRPRHYQRIPGEDRFARRARLDRARLEAQHPELQTMWKDLEALPQIKRIKAEQPKNISRELKPFQLEGLSWMKAMEKTEWGGGLLGDEMGMGKTIQAVSLIMSDYPAKMPSLVLIPPVALMQWQQEMGDYTDGTLKTFVFHGTNLKTKGMTTKELMRFDVILMSYNSLESMYRHQEKGFKRKDKLHFEKSVIHQIKFHRVILDEAHNIKQRTTGVAKACFALKADHKWCLSGTPLQNRIGEFFSLVRFLDIRPFACYFCKQCPCSTLEWTMNELNRCTGCNHSGMQHVSVFNQELLNPIQKHGNKGPGKEAFAKLRLLTDRFMLRRVKRDHSAAMELPAKEIHVDRQFFGEEENDFAGSIMNSGTRKFETYVAQGVLLNNYANIFGLIMQMRQVADHPDLILKKNGEGGQNILVCCICDEVAEDAIRSSCKHEFCRLCVKNYLHSTEDVDVQPDCPRCHIPLAIDLEQPEIEQDEQNVKKSSIINRIKMENWTSSSKIEALVYDIHALRSNKSSTKSIIFSQFTTMLQLVEWRLRRAGITTVMLDGSMTPAQRQASINAFMTNPNIECFLVSLKAGGVALNLTEASKVFIVDPWWNPAAEWQSADRCHRIGQCRPCSITRLCIEDSVESRMVLLQEKKANMINSTINNDESAMESLTPEDMQFLFRGT